MLLSSAIHMNKLIPTKQTTSWWQWVIKYTKIKQYDYANNNDSKVCRLKCAIKSDTISGEDFNYQDANMWYKNLDKLIKYMNQTKVYINRFSCVNQIILVYVHIYVC